jgi:thiamine biosynthesis lipoprotein ApbE
MKPAPTSIIRLVGLDQLTRFEHEAMNTTFTLHLGASADGSSLRPIAEEAFRQLDQFEARLSFYREGSDVTRINRAAEGESLRIDDSTYHCLLNAMEVSAATEGAFDPFAGYASVEAKAQTIPHHLRDLSPPASEDQAPVLAIAPDQPIVTKLAGRRWLDLGAVGKGAALDGLAEMLQEWDIATAVLSGGGSSLLVLGPPPDKSRETWALDLPQSPGAPTLQLPAPFALGASGDGFQPGHIISHDSAATARPQSLVLAPNAAMADALSTAAILLSNEKLESIIGDTPGFGVYATHAEAAAIAVGELAEQIENIGPEVSLIIPCWCESQRLPVFLRELCASIEQAQLPVEVIVVDDGSPAPEPAQTQHAIDDLRAQFKFLREMQRVPQHRGKGGAIYHGWRQSSATARWLAFVDADGAVPPSAIVQGIADALVINTKPPIIASNRYHRRADLKVRRDWLRQRTGGWFAQWAARKLNLPVRDSQCGFKLVPAKWWRARDQQKWQELGYAFDLELLLTAQADGIPIRDMDIAWTEIGGSNVGLRDGIELVQTVRRLAAER